MTILGIALDDGAALAWADDEVFDGGVRVGSRRKLHAHPTAPAVLMGSGAVVLLVEAEAAFRNAPGFDGAADHVGHVLREAAATMADIRRRHRSPYPAPSCTVFVAGYSAHLRRMVAWRLAARAEYRPRIVTHEYSPAPPGADLFDGLRGVPAIVRRQVAALRRHTHDGRGGTVDVAIITAAGVTRPPSFRALDGAPVTHPA